MFVEHEPRVNYFRLFYINEHVNHNTHDVEILKVTIRHLFLSIGYNWIIKITD